MTTEMPPPGRPATSVAWRESPRWGAPRILSGGRGRPRPDQAEDAGVAVHECRSLDRGDFAGAEHAGDRDVDHATQRAGIMAGDAEQAAPAAGAGKEQRSLRLQAPLQRFGEPCLEFLRGGTAVAQVELHDRVARDAGTDPQGAGLRVEAEDVAHQEIARADDLPRARQGDADAQRVAEARAVGLGERRE